MQELTVAQTKKAFLKTCRDVVVARASQKGVVMTKECVDQIVLQYATDALNGESAKILKIRLDQMLMC